MEAEFGEFSGKTSGEAGAFRAIEVIGAEVGIKDAASEHPADGGDDGAATATMAAYSGERARPFRAPAACEHASGRAAPAPPSAARSSIG